MRVGAFTNTVISVWPTSRHQAGRSSFTLISRLRTSSTPWGSGCMAFLMINSSPLPQSRSPPSQMASGRRFPGIHDRPLRLRRELAYIRMARRLALLVFGATGSAEAILIRHDEHLWDQ